ncbi:MAG TPA: DUF1206 domain-containing protein [Chthoniobacteraceae bacterium]|jgi:hypothetical protein
MHLPKGDALEQIGRLGYAAKSIIYLAVGLLSARAGMDGGKARDSRDVLQTIAEQPFGKILLTVLLAGIACYIIWRLILVFGPALTEGAKAWLVRIRSLLSAGTYSGLGIAAVKVLTGSSSKGGGGGESSARGWTTQLMDAPAGKWLVVAAGAGFIAYALAQWRRAWTRSFDKKLHLGSLSAGARQTVTRISAGGIAARGVAFCLAGLFLVSAGLQADPSKARGLSGSLNALRDQPFGRWLLVGVALGLSGYGIYCALKARYGRIRE